VSTRLAVAEVRFVPAGRGIVAHGLDAPRTADEFDEYSLSVAGWVIGAKAPVRSVELWVDGRVVKRSPVDVVRPDVAERHPAVATVPCGFTTGLGLLGMPPRCTVEVRAALEDGDGAPLGEIVVDRRALPHGAAAAFQPLMVTSLGRMGTTWCMRLLAEHPSVVAYRSYPYELMVGRYWAHQLHVLAGPADYDASGSPDTFAHDEGRVGSNPFYGPMVRESPDLAHYLGGTQVERLARFCVESIDGFYGELARRQEQHPHGYFAEKFLPDHLPSLMRELYPAAREIFLVRDIRDVVCSMLAFNAKRGNQSFGRDKARDDVEFVRQLARDIAVLRDHWEARGSSGLLVRYEDLVRHPRSALRRMLAYLELDHDGATVDGILGRADGAMAGFADHRTSAGPEQSIGRWRRDLAPELLAVCEAEMDATLAAFGYEVRAA